MRTIIAGGRDIVDYEALESAITDSGFQITEVVSGGARGVDAMGEAWAESKNIPVRVFEADWAKNGKSAGPFRNWEMAQYAEALIAIWDGRSKGTINMIDTARRKDLPIHIHKV